MSAKRGINCSVLFNEFDLSTYFKQANMSAGVDLLDGTPFQAANGDKVFVPGFTEGKVSLEGFFESDETDEDAVDDVLNSVIGSESRQVVTISPEGISTLGNRCYLIDADVVSYKVTSPATGLIMSTADIQSSSELGNGRVLQILGAVTADGNGTNVDHGAATSYGGAGHLHVTAFGDDTDSIDVKIQHSSDNSTWVDLITFTTATGITSERIEVTGTVNRHLRAVRDIEGSDPTATIAVAFARFNQ